MTIDKDMAELTERCQNILEWKRTGILPDGALRTFASTLRNAANLEDHQKLMVAEDQTGLECMQIVIDHSELLGAEINGLKLPAADAPLVSASLGHELRKTTGLMAQTAKIRPDIWQRHAIAALKAAKVLEAVEMPQSDAPVQIISPATGSKSDQQIIDEVNALAHELLGHVCAGFVLPPDHLFYVSKHPRAQKAWAAAVAAYELMTGSEIHDALQVVLGEDA